MASLPELRTYNCNDSRVTVTEAEKLRERRELVYPFLVRVASWIIARFWLHGGDPAMNTQVTKRALPFWIQIAPLVVLSVVVCALAAKYIW